MTAAQLVDLTLLALLVIQVGLGWTRGLVSTVFGVIGYLGGALIALWGLSTILALTPIAPDSQLRTIAMLVGVLGIAAALHGLMSHWGTRLRPARGSGGVRLADALGGAAVNALVSLVVVGLITLALLPVVPGPWRRTLQESRVASTLAELMPGQVLAATSKLTIALYDAGFPPVFGNPLDEPRMRVEAPEAAVVDSPGIQAARASVVKILSDAPGCNRLSEGSGWVAAPGRVITNAHVVAAARKVTLRLGGTERELSATVIWFDPARDVAVLDVPGLRAPALRIAGPLPSGASAVMAGFPLNGPYRLEPARIRGAIQANGRDIYGTNSATREIYSIYAEVNPGNSGGPLLTPQGEVAGTVFARSRVSPDTGFVLTNRATSEALGVAHAAGSSPVPTGGCTED